MNFGPLRVFNDDVVAPAGGFPFHSHREMEIITYIVEGALRIHRDDNGQRRRRPPWRQIQRMKRRNRRAPLRIQSIKERLPCACCNSGSLPSVQHLQPSLGAEKLFVGRPLPANCLPIAVAGRKQCLAPRGNLASGTVQSHQDAKNLILRYLAHRPIHLHTQTRPKSASLHLRNRPGHLKLNGENARSRRSSPRHEVNANWNLAAAAESGAAADFLLLDLP